ncbi:Nucleoid occlusion protein [subsurface metagenome]
MATKDIQLELIDDNPYNPRKHYPRNKVDAMAHSLKEMGQLEIPKARESNGHVQLSQGHLRKRAFLKLQKQDPKKWTTMRLDVEGISDEDMFYFSLEENLQRTDVTPLEIARSIDSFITLFPNESEGKVGKKFKMGQANVANMRRVLRLPEEILQKIDDGRINFTQGRELLVLERLPDPVQMMKTAVSQIKTEKMHYGMPNTVEGIQQAVHNVVGNHTLPLDKQWEGYRHTILFDTRAAGCLKCDRMIITRPTKSVSAHYCLDEKCWEEHQEEHRQKAAAAAKAQMEADILRRTAQEIEAPPISQEIPPLLEKRIVEVDAELMDKVNASYSGDRIAEGSPLRRPFTFEKKQFICTGGDSEKWECYQLLSIEDYKGETRTYKVPQGRESNEYYQSLRNTPEGFYHGMLVHKGAKVLIGPPTIFSLQTKEELPGEVKAADETDRFLEKVAKETESQADERNRQMEEARERANLERTVGEIPCDTCAKGESCDRTFFHVADDGSGRLICDVWECDHVSWATPPPTEIPEDILALAKEKAGTRAEVLDVNDIVSKDYYQREVKSGYTVLKGGYHDELRYMDDPTECTEKCTRGFHFGFDSKDDKGTVYFICTDTKCLAKKKAAFTRNKNAEGQARKKAEVKAVKQAIDLVGQVISDGKQLLDEEGKFTNMVVIPRATLKLILLAQIKGKHLTNYYYGESLKKPEKWLWDKISAGTPENDRATAKLFKAIDKLSDEVLAKLVVEFMFHYIMDHRDIGTYEIQAEEPLKWMGVTIEQGANDEKESTESTPAGKVSEEQTVAADKS